MRHKTMKINDEKIMNCKTEDILITTNLVQETASNMHCHDKRFAASPYKSLQTLWSLLARRTKYTNVALTKYTAFSEKMEWVDL